MRDIQLIMLLRKNLLIVDEINTSFDNMYLVKAICADIFRYGYFLDINTQMYLAKADATHIKEINDLIIEFIHRKHKLDVVDYKPLFIDFPNNVIVDTDWYRTHFYLYNNGNDDINFFEECGHIAENYLNLGYCPICHTELDIHVDKNEIVQSKRVNTIELGTLDVVNDLVKSLLLSKRSISDRDKIDLGIILFDAIYYKNHFNPSIISDITFKENIAYLVGLISDIHHELISLDQLDLTVIDVLRIACALSGGDITLTRNTRFKFKNRAFRRYIVELLAKSNLSDVDGLVKYKERFIRLSEVIHLGEYKNKYPVLVDVFDKLRKNEYATTGSIINRLIKERDFKGLEDLLCYTPGFFARYIAYFLRNGYNPTRFSNVINKVSSPVLLQLNSALNVLFKQVPNKVIVPKYSNSNIYLKITENVDEIDIILVSMYMDMIDTELKSRYQYVDSPLRDKKIFLDSSINEILVPMAMRQSVESTKTLTRGSSIKIAEDTKMLRLFMYWEQVGQTTDLDLSVVFYDDTFETIGSVSFMNLGDDIVRHSGDVRSAANGGVEYIDIDLTKLRRDDKWSKAAYGLFVVTNYDGDSFDSMDNAFAGFEAYNYIKTDRSFDIDTVVNRYKLMGDSVYVIPMVFDFKNMKFIWAELQYNVKIRYPSINKAVKYNNFMLKAMLSYGSMRPKVTDLLALHDLSIVDDKDIADIIIDDEYFSTNIELFNSVLL